MILIISISLFIRFSNAVSITCPSYPVGLGGTAGGVNFTALDVTTNGDMVVIGGDCTDSTLCPSSTLPDPIIQLVETLSR